MFCKKCGAELEDSVEVCHICGEAAGEPEKKASADTPQADALATSGLTYSIIGGVLLWIFPPVGIVFSYLAMKKFKEYKALSEIPCTKANVGNILALAGLILNIISTVLTVMGLIAFVIYFVFIVGISAIPAFMM